MDTRTLSLRQEGDLPASSHAVKVDSFPQAADLVRFLHQMMVSAKERDGWS
jgi:hypothetical protein